MNERKLVTSLAIKNRDYIFNKGIYDLSRTSIEFATLLLSDLSEHSVNAVGLTGWLKLPNKEDRVFIMYVKIKLKNKDTLYIDIFNGENIVYNEKMKSLKKSRKPKNKKCRRDT